MWFFHIPSFSKKYFRIRHCLFPWGEYGWFWSLLLFEWNGRNWHQWGRLMIFSSADKTSWLRWSGFFSELFKGFCLAWMQKHFTVFGVTDTKCGSEIHATFRQAMPDCSLIDQSTWMTPVSALLPKRIWWSAWWWEMLGLEKNSVLCCFVEPQSRWPCAVAASEWCWGSLLNSHFHLI